MNIKNVVHLIAISLIIIGSASCTTDRIVYKTIELERPARPVLPKLSEKQAQKIEQTTWNILVTRHRMLRQYAEELETIIDATKQP